MFQPEQRRILATSIPGPKSQKLQTQRAAELSGGLGITSLSSSSELGAASWSMSTAITSSTSHLGSL
jgi:hypothetical protein